MISDAAIYVKNFNDRLNSREYMIDNAAREIMYDNISLAYGLSEALANYKIVSSASFAPNVPAAEEAQRWINRAFIHNVVIDRNDLRNKLKETQSRLQLCDEEKAKLEKHNSILFQKLTDANTKIEALEKELKRSGSDTGDVRYG